MDDGRGAVSRWPPPRLPGPRPFGTWSPSGLPPSPPQPIEDPAGKPLPDARPHARPAREAGGVALPFELVEDEHAHREESDDHEDRHGPVAATASQPLRICKESSGAQWGPTVPRPGLLGWKTWSGRCSRCG